MDAANAVPVIGTPLAYGLGFVILLLILLTDSWARSLVTVVHEGGHMVLAVLTFRGHEGFTLTDGGGGGTSLVRYHWSVSDLVVRFAGYPAPCLVGLGGALLLRSGRPASVLWIAVVLLLASFMEAANALAIVVTAVAVLGVGWVVLRGGTALQAGTAVLVVWWMLIGGAYYSSVGLSRGDTSDAAVLAQRTLVPRIVWHAVWAAIGAVCLWKGGRALLAV